MTDRLGRLLFVTLEAARVDADMPALGALRFIAGIGRPHRRGLRRVRMDAVGQRVEPGAIVLGKVVRQRYEKVGRQRCLRKEAGLRAGQRGEAERAVEPV